MNQAYADQKDSKLNSLYEALRRFVSLISLLSLHSSDDCKGERTFAAAVGPGIHF